MKRVIDPETGCSVAMRLEDLGRDLEIFGQLIAPYDATQWSNAA